MQLEVSRISLSFGTRNVLNDVSLSLRGPSMAALMGPSGSGKTSLLAIIAGQIRDYEGSVSIAVPNGHPRTDWVFQTSPLLSYRSAIDNVVLGALAAGLSRDIATVHAMTMMAELGVKHLAGIRAGALSGGERQRIAIARGLSAGADLLLVDEPTAALDAGSRQNVCEALRAAAQSTLVLIATHDEFVASYCDETFLISGGSLSRRTFAQ